MQSPAASSSTEAMDDRRNGILLRILMGFVKALQDARQREADCLLADYRASAEPSLLISQSTLHHLVVNRALSQCAQYNRRRKHRC
jgi:hypothetical protein